MPAPRIKTQPKAKLTEVYHVVVSLSPLQIVLHALLQPLQIICHGLVDVAALALLQALVDTSDGIRQARHLLAIPFLLQAIAGSAVLGGAGKVVVLRTHVVNPSGADGLAAYGGLAGQAVEVRHANGELGDGSVPQTVHDGLLPVALLALGQEQLGQGLKGRLIHIVGRVGHAQLGQDLDLHVLEHAGSLREVARRRLQPLGIATVGCQSKLGV